LLDRLIKDIVTESETFHVEQFLPLLQTYIRRTNPYIRQLLVGWITVLDSIPDISMIDYLPDFLDGLFNVSDFRQSSFFHHCLAKILTRDSVLHF
jgi:vacuole morphology and inheritance protein 14